MNLKFTKKKIFIIILALFALIVLTITIILNKNKTDDLSRTIEREYLAENSSITVGVDAVGQIELIGKQLSMQNGLTVKDLLVEVGDEVKTGDTLLTLDKDQIDKTLKELQIKRNTAASVLKTAIDNKNLTQSLSNSKIDDVKHQSQQAYDNSITAIKQNIDSLNLQIAQTTEQIQNLEAQITNISELEIENNNQDLHEQINVLREQLATLQSSLASANAECVALENNRNDEIARENASVSLMQKENDIQLVSLQTAIDTAQADVNKIDEEILATTKLLEVQSLIATVDGVVLSISVQAGQTIGVELGALNNSYEQGGSSVVIVIGEKSQQQFTVLVESSEINNIEVGQQVEFECVAFPGQKFTGKISNRKLVPNDGKYEVTVMVDENTTEFQQGMAVSATLIITQKIDILTLSNKAINMKDDGTQFVKVKDSNNNIKEVTIVTGFSDGRVSEILSGLVAGDIVIVEDII